MALRDEQTDSERYSKAHDRGGHMVDRHDLMTWHTVQEEEDAKFTVGPNAPDGGPSPTVYTVGTRGAADEV